MVVLPHTVSVVALGLGAPHDELRGLAEGSGLGPCMTLYMVLPSAAAPIATPGLTAHTQPFDSVSPPHDELRGRKAGPAQHQRVAPLAIDGQPAVVEVALPNI